MRYNRKTIFINWITTSTLLTAGGCAVDQPPWENISGSGQLRLVTVSSPTTCYRTADGFAGFECDLAGRLARKLGVNLQVNLVPDPGSAVDMITRGQADIGAGFMDTGEQLQLQRSHGWYETSLQLVYRSSEDRPESAASLSGRTVQVGSDQLSILQRHFPEVRWQAAAGRDAGFLLRELQEGRLAVTVANAQQVNAYRHLYPNLRVAFNLTDAQPVFWIYAHDERLNNAVIAFGRKQVNSGKLAALQEQYFGHVSSFAAADIHRFLHMIRERLPDHEPLFRRAASRHGMDWTLLAAMGYQESHWHGSARSRTGVRGLMMLTRETASDLGVQDRLDPWESVDGGTRYYLDLHARIPQRIAEPDRTWLALAAYNIGFGHLEDARILTQRLGGNPDRWLDVRRHLPLLGDDRWHVRTLNGKARGREAVQYVENIRVYHDVLRWLNPAPAVDTAKVSIFADAVSSLAPFSLRPL